MLPIDLFVNAFLASKGLRNMMIQPIDYNEDMKLCPKTESYLQQIKILFPSLHQSHVYPGIICSHTPYTNGDLIDDNNLGQILGYPCHMDFKKGGELVFYVKVKAKDGSHHQLFANIACDRSKEAKFVSFVEKANSIINENIECMNGIVEKDCVYYCVKSNFSSKTLIKRLIDKTFNDEYKESLEQNLGNLFATCDDIVGHIDFTNPVHVGIVIGLLTTQMHNPVEHFYPVPSTMISDVEETMNTWGKKIVHYLDKTKKTKIQTTFFSFLTEFMENYNHLEVCVNGTGTISVYNRETKPQILMGLLEGDLLLKRVEFDSNSPYESLEFSIERSDGWKLKEFRYNDDYDIFCTRGVHPLNITADDIDLNGIKMYSRYYGTIIDILSTLEKKTWTDDDI